MPTTRTGRQSSPSKDVDSPSKMRVQPMRGARLRSASPFLDTASASASTSAPASQALSSTTTSPSKSTRASPRKKAAAASTSLQAPVRRSTRSRSRSVDHPESLTVIDEDDSPVQTQETASEEQQAESSRAASTSVSRGEGNAISEPRLATVTEEDALLPATTDAYTSAEEESSSSSSDSESDSDASSSSASSSEDEEDDSQVDLDALLKASQQAFKSRAPVPTGQSRFEDNQDVISFESVSDSTSDTKRAGKTMPLVVKAKHQMAKTHPASSSGKSTSKDKLDKQIEAIDQAPIEADKKKSKHARTVQTSTGSSWFDMPEFGASASRIPSRRSQEAIGRRRWDTPRRLVVMLVSLPLSNCVAKFRHYDCETRSTRNDSIEHRQRTRPCPNSHSSARSFASPLEPKAVLSRQERGRTVVEELIRDAEAASYAKRKFAESQASHRSNYNGRRKPPSKKKRT